MAMKTALILRLVMWMVFSKLAFFSNRYRKYFKKDIKLKGFLSIKLKAGIRISSDLILKKAALKTTNELSLVVMLVVHCARMGPNGGF